MFLPTTLKEVRARGWDQLDVILFTGDAYIDHPSFGAAVVGRLLEAEGYRVAIVPQPNWRDDLRDFTKLGTPRLFFGVTAGAMDSMVNHYTANIRLRSNDAYTPGGKAGFRPDYAVKTYTQNLKRLFPRTPVVIGGIEASLRRLTHYDYWSDSLHPSILADSGADLLIYGMGERVIQQVARAMNNGFNAKLLRNIRQVGFMADRSYVERLDPARTIRLHSYEECVADKRAFGENFTRIETLSNLMEPDETLVEGVGDRYAVITPPNATLTTEELDHSFDLPYERAPHPRYRDRGDIPAWEMIKHSVNIHRGCFGGCSFCTISAHQGKFITSRSEKSILREVERVTRMLDFRVTFRTSERLRPTCTAWAAATGSCAANAAVRRVCIRRCAPTSITTIVRCSISMPKCGRSRGSRKLLSAAVSATTCSMAAITSIRSSATIPRAASKWRRNIPRILC